MDEFKAQKKHILAIIQNMNEHFLLARMNCRLSRKKRMHVAIAIVNLSKYYYIQQQQQQQCSEM
ncbi:hypothetical protein DERP_012954 [Dermatophagoides pteronyssinus]|uniref:Uncharacterized protein n=1 Tax=Dermatophagoides pteronyssinus TaxID=6956 RepID=A0ABQ8ISH9_DERPT|nr:hypothetical protein DERP_012954 [Dermatophagoides pteronyssinus]